MQVKQERKGVISKGLYGGEKRVKKGLYSGMKRLRHAEKEKG